MKPIRLISGFVTVGLWTLLSRIAGFVRDIFIAAYLGTGPVAEAFLVAFSLPNLFRRFFAEGAFNMAFVPMFSKKVESGEGAKRFAQDAFAGMAGLLTVFTVVGVIFMPALVALMASGFIGSERFDLAVYYGRIAFPYILFISLSALLSGVLNATGRFTAAAAAPVLLNIIFIVALLGAATYFDFAASEGQQTLGAALAWAVPLAGIAQLATVWIAAKRAGYGLRFGWPKLTPELKRLAIIAAPAALAGGVVQINLLVGRQVASSLTARWPGFPMPTGSINCPWVWSGSRLALCCCRTCRGACKRGMTRAVGMRSTALRRSASLSRSPPRSHSRSSPCRL